MADTTEPRKCAGTTKKGKPCGASPLKDTTFCLAHSDEEVRDSMGFGGAQPGAGRPRVSKPAEVAQRLVLDNELAIQRPYWRVLGYDVRIGPDGPYLVELIDPETGERAGGAKLYGTSKDGIVKMSGHEDLGAQINAAEKIQDRAFGKARQAVEHSGPEGGPIETAGVVNVVPAGDRRAEILSLIEPAVNAEPDERSA